MYFTDIILSKGSQTFCTEYVLYISIGIKLRTRQNKSIVLTSGWLFIFGGHRAARGRAEGSGGWSHRGLRLGSSASCTILRCTPFFACVFTKVTQKGIKRRTINQSENHQ